MSLSKIEARSVTRRRIKLLIAVVLPAFAYAGQPVSDDFHSTALDTGRWTVVNPAGDGSYSLTGSHLLLTVPGGSNHDPRLGGNNSVRAVQSVDNADFQIQLKFGSKPAAQYEMQGLLVEQDSGNYLRFEFASDGAGTYISASKIVSSTETILLSTPIALPGGNVWLRVTRSGDNWTEEWSADGSAFQPGATFAQSLTVARVGPYAANFNSQASQAPGFTAAVDYFLNTAAPFAAEDANGPDLSLVAITPMASGAKLNWTTDVPASSLAEYGPTASYGSNASDAALATDHQLILTGLACATAYEVRVTSATATGSTVSPSYKLTTASCASASGPVSDNFDAPSLNTSIWTLQDPSGNSYLTFNGKAVQITEHANEMHDAWGPAGNGATRIVQPIADSDFDVAAKFVSNLDWATTSQGIVVEQDPQNYLRFEFRTDGLSTRVWAGSRAGADEKVLLNVPYNASAPLWLRVARASNNWTVSFSIDGSQYNPAGTFSYTLTAASLGLYASNTSDTPATTPAFTATIDSFTNMATPLAQNADAQPPFKRIVIDPNPGTVLVQETMGDLDGDGRPDGIVGFEEKSHGIAWYRSPHTGVLTDHWDRFIITPTGECYEDVTVFDVNGDGAKDVIASIDGAIKWYENPMGHGGDATKDVWQEHVVDPQAPGENNFILVDFDGDGTLDMATPHSVYFRTGPDSWQRVDYNTAFRGLALLDIGSGKGAINLIGTSPNKPYSFVWFENPRETGGDARTGTWTPHYIGPAYVCDDPPSCFGGGSVANLASGDLNGDGRMDLVTVQSEGYPVVPPGGLMWFEAPADRRQPWIKHTIDPDFPSPHNVWIADMDKNGTLDVIAAEQEQGPGRRIAVFFNDGKANFSMQVLSNTGSHNPFLIDMNGDGWLDLFSVGHGRFGAPNPVELYINPGGTGGSSNPQSVGSAPGRDQRDPAHQGSHLAAAGHGR